MEKIHENLKAAIRHLQIADHMAYVTLPLVNEQRLLIKIFDEIYKTLLNSINAILNYEYMYKRIKIYSNKKENIKTFATKSAKTYGISNQQVKQILEIIELNRKHIESSMEFVRKDKIVILSDNLKTQTLDIQIIKTYLVLCKDILMKINHKMQV